MHSCKPILNKISTWNHHGVSEKYCADNKSKHCMFIFLLLTFLAICKIEMTHHHFKSKTVMINTIVIVTRVVTISEVESESVSVVLCRQCCVVLCC